MWENQISDEDQAAVALTAHGLPAVTRQCPHGMRITTLGGLGQSPRQVFMLFTFSEKTKVSRGYLIPAHPAGECLLLASKPTTLFTQAHKLTLSDARGPAHYRLESQIWQFLHHPLFFPNWVEIKDIPLTLLTDELLISNIFRSLKGFSSVSGELFLGLLHILPKLLHEFLELLSSCLNKGQVRGPLPAVLLLTTFSPCRSE